MLAQSPASSTAVVSRPPLRPNDANAYLRHAQGGAVAWTFDPQEAETFETMREAARAAVRLPGGLRAFALPLHSELTAHCA